MNRWVYAIVVAALAGGAAIAMLGESDGRVGFSAPLEVWGQMLRDVDQVGLRATRISDTDEMKFGERLDAAWKAPGASDEWTAYVGAVGERLAPHVRRTGIRYSFVAVQTPTVNAFAIPGGRIVVTTGLLEFVQTKAELAAVIGHEMSHVDLRHCIERYQYALRLQKAGFERTPAAVLLDVNRMLIASGYSKYQEIEADEQGVRLAIQAGYDPDGGPTAMARLVESEGHMAAAHARTPVGEVGRAVEVALGSYFRSHPLSSERQARMAALVERNRRRLAGTEAYIGRENLRRRTARSTQEFAGERRRM